MKYTVAGIVLGVGLLITWFLRSGHGGDAPMLIIATCVACLFAALPFIVGRRRAKRSAAARSEEKIIVCVRKTDA